VGNIQLQTFQLSKRSATAIIMIVVSNSWHKIKCHICHGASAMHAWFGKVLAIPCGLAFALAVAVLEDPVEVRQDRERRRNDRLLFVLDDDGEALEVPDLGQNLRIRFGRILRAKLKPGQIVVYNCYSYWLLYKYIPLNLIFLSKMVG
jgi:hypothetical protein